MIDSYEKQSTRKTTSFFNGDTFPFLYPLSWDTISSSSFDSFFFLFTGANSLQAFERLVWPICCQKGSLSTVAGKERGIARQGGRISKPESQTGTRLYIQENSELRGSQRRRGPIEETGGAGCSDSEVANRLLCCFSGEWLSSPKFLYLYLLYII